MRIWSATVSFAPTPPSASSPPASTSAWRWFFVILAVLPFQLPLLQHLLTGRIATGFLLYDAPYYMANARAIFERGNGFAYPNAYDPDPNAPVIYFHWLLWLLGAGVKFLHLDPGALFAVLGVVASIACSAFTLRLVELTLPDSRGRNGWFLLTMWGGGIVVLTSASLNAAQGLPVWDDLFRLDVGEGWWFPNWGRNLILSTEAVYHCLVAVIWIGVLQKRWTLALGAAGALAATHPFSGIQHLLILSTWCGWLALRDRTPAAWGRVSILGVIGTLFGAYYFWYLNQFPAHRALTAVWSTVHDVKITSVLLAVAPLAAIATLRFRREEWKLNDTSWFLLTAFAVTFLLMKHDWLIAPHQPAHFSRGYHWLPLWLLALPQMQAWAVQLAKSRGRLVAGIVLTLFGILTVTDNAAFLARDLNSGERDRVHLSDDQREMFAWMNHEKLRGVLLCYDTRIGYHAPVYTSVRSYLGHLNNTPDVRARWRDVAAWQRQGETGPWFETIDYILIERTKPPLAFDWSKWRELHGNQEYVLLGRAANPK